MKAGSVNELPARGGLPFRLMFSVHNLKMVVYWQGVSLLLTLIQVISQAMTNRGMTCTATINAAFYALLFLIYSPFSAKESSPQPLWKFFMISLFDVEGGYLVLLSYRYTSLTSVTLLDCFAIVVVLVVSMILGARFFPNHYVGCLLCILGIGCLLIADTSSHNASSPLLGDFLCILGAGLYGLSNVSAEFFLKQMDFRRYLARIGFFGAVISGIQGVCVEWSDILHWPTSWQATMLFVAYIWSMFLFYTAVALMLQISDACLMNLSLLTTDVYVLVAGYFIFNNGFSLFYFLSLGLTVFGVCLYNCKSPIPFAAFQEKEYVSIPPD